MRRPGVLSCEACAALCAAVDKGETTARDSVDGAVTCSHLHPVV